MPVRDKAVDVALRSVLGPDTEMWFYNKPGAEVAHVAGEAMPHEEYVRRYIDPIERAYERVMDSIDWNRVMLEAMSRHLSLDHEDHADYKYVCPECICEALLADGTHVDWKREPKSPRHHSDE